VADRSGRDPGPLALLIARHIAESGPIGFDEYVGHALYHPTLGFYCRGGGAGRRRDFLTSPEVGPLFGAVLARALDHWWHELGEPEDLVLLEVGAGPGTLARSLRAAGPRCLGHLHHVLVEVGRTQWSTHPDGVVSTVDVPVSAELPDAPVVVLANELMDNLPFGLVVKTSQGWCEVAVGNDGDPTRGRLVEVFRELDDPRRRWCDDRAGEDAPVGARLAVHSHAAAWLGDMVSLGANRGVRVVAIDYTSTSEEMAHRPWTEWLRTYASHGRSGHPLDDPGSCDITTEIAVDQLDLVKPPTRVRTQAQFLADHEIDALVAEGWRRWDQTGITGGLKAIEGRSRALEAEALSDPTGLGAFSVLEWVVPPGAPIRVPAGPHQR